MPSISQSVVIRSARVLPQEDQRKLIYIVFLQIFLGALDLLGVAFIGVLGALAVNGIQSSPPGNRVTQVLQVLNLDGQSFQTQTAIIGGLAAFLLISRTVASVLFTRRIIFFLSRRGAFLASELLAKYLTQPLISIQNRKSTEALYALTIGVNSVTLGILSLSLTVISDVSLLLVMSIGLFIVDPYMAFGTFFIFGGIGFILYKLLNVRAKKLGLNESELNIQTNTKVLEVLSSYREIVVRNRREYYAQQIGNIRYSLADTQAEMFFMPNIGKYVIESAIVLGGLLLAGIQFMRTDAAHAVATLSLFLAAGSRIAPAILRVQQSAIQIRSNVGAATPTLNLIDELENVQIPESGENTPSFDHLDFSPTVLLQEVSFVYPNRAGLALSNVSVAIHTGESVAIVGPSGAGKTTLVDVLLGVLEPVSGKVLIGNLAPLDAIRRSPGAIAYVPQDVTILDATIRENVVMGFPPNKEFDPQVNQALESAQFSLMDSDAQLTLESRVGERGAVLSGGQRQRLGIARALFTKPRLLVLDEATSSLDGQTEAAVAQAIQKLRGESTVVTIAHRLSTVRAADRVIYMEAGKILASGTFDEVRALIPDFDSQAKLMGL
jgi:ABC-type multidrug transport system fused ATPase/permease subunit